MTREETTAFFDRRLDAMTRHDSAALAADYAPGCVVESRMAGTVTGRAANEEVYRAWFAAFPDAMPHREVLLIDGTQVAEVATLAGTDKGGFMGLPASGKSFQFTIAFLYTMKDGQIVHERRVYDFVGMLVQLGVLKTKPA